MNDWLDITILDFFVFIMYLFGILFYIRRYRKIGNRRYENLFLSISIIHILSTVYYFTYIFILNNPGDSKIYYLLSLNYDFKNQQGSEFIVLITSILTTIFKLKLIGSMFVFSFIGLIGWKLLLDVIGNVLNYKWTNWLYILVLPQMHFWTCSLGKDSLSFFAISSILYSWYYNKKFINYLLPGFLLLFIRSHIFLLVISAFLISIIFQKRVKIHLKVFLTIIGITIIILSIPLVKERLSLDELNINSAISYSEELLSRNQSGGASVDMSNSNIIVKMFSYIARPFFFDASTILQVEASFENFFWLLMLLFIIYRHKKKYIALFPFFAFLILWFINSAVLTNLAIAMRQKMMFFPFLYYQFIVYMKSKPTNTD